LPARASLTRERVLRAALALADEKGVESLSMRLLGRRLGVEAMSLYNHVANKDEILALRIIYNQSYKNRQLTLDMVKELYEKLAEPPYNLSNETLWESYFVKHPAKVKGRGSVRMLTDIVSLLRFELGYANELTPFAENINFNFMRWTLAKNAGKVHFTEEQMEWLRMIKDHIATSVSVQADDLELEPFDRKGGLGKFYQLFGDKYEDLLNEINEALVA